MTKNDYIAFKILHWKKNSDGLYFDGNNNVRLPLFQVSLNESNILLRYLQSNYDVNIQWIKDTRMWSISVDKYIEYSLDLPTCIINMTYTIAKELEMSM